MKDEQGKDTKGIIEVVQFVEEGIRNIFALSKRSSQKKNKLAQEL